MDASNSLLIVNWYNVLIGLGLIAIAVGLTYFQGFGMEKDIIIGTIRSILQLIFIGYALVYIFNIRSIWPTTGILAFMALIAAFTARGRIRPSYPGAVPILWFSMSVGSFVAVWMITKVAIHDPEATSPRYLVPLGSMMIGNALNGLSIGGERFRSELISQKDLVESLLAMGAPSKRAVADCVRTSFSAAMIPTINMMMVIGLIQIPGIMTGQVLAGVNPLDAARYQLLVIFMMCGGKVIVTSLALHLGARKYFTSAHQLRSELLQA
jgi:putative ABC transport system permease protein